MRYTIVSSERLDPNGTIVSFDNAHDAIVLCCTMFYAAYVLDTETRNVIYRR